MNFLGFLWMIRSANGARFVTKRSTHTTVVTVMINYGEKVVTDAIPVKVVAYPVTFQV